MAQIKSLNCPNCGGSIPDTSMACNYCGSRVILSDDRQKFVLAGTICPKCGLDNKDQHRFCSKCGEKLFKECLECKKEIGLDAMHCPFCGDNIDNAVKEKETALAKRAHSIKQLVQLKPQLQPFYVKLQPLSNQYDEIARSIRNCYGTSLTANGGTPWQFYLILYPIGALILSVVAYFIGFRISFMVNFIVSYLIIYAIFNWIPRKHLKDLEQQRDSLMNEMRVINTEIGKISFEINMHESILNNVRDKYGAG